MSWAQLLGARRWVFSAGLPCVPTPLKPLGSRTAILHRSRSAAEAYMIAKMPDLPTTPAYRHSRIKDILAAVGLPFFVLVNRPSLRWLAEAAYDIALRCTASLSASMASTA